MIDIKDMSSVMLKSLIKSAKEQLVLTVKQERMVKQAEKDVKRQQRLDKRAEKIAKLEAKLLATKEMIAKMNASGATLSKMGAAVGVPIANR